MWIMRAGDVEAGYFQVIQPDIENFKRKEII
jgi:hypothetical protein